MEKNPLTLEAAVIEIRYLRSENAELKAKLAEVSSELAKVNSELAKVNSELAKIKESLGLNSQNSSKPPSSDVKKPPKKLGSLGRSRGGQKGHPGTHREMVAGRKVDRGHRLSTCEQMCLWRAGGWFTGWCSQSGV